MAVDEDLGFAEQLREIRELTGLDLEYLPDRYGGMFRARTRDEEWVWVCDAEEGLEPADRRLHMEAAGIDIGWRVCVHPADHGGEHCRHEVMCSVRDDSAMAEDLPRLVAETLAHRAANGHVRYRRDHPAETVTGIFSH